MGTDVCVHIDFLNCKQRNFILQRHIILVGSVGELPTCLQSKEYSTHPRYRTSEANSSTFSNTANFNSGPMVVRSWKLYWLMYCSIVWDYIFEFSCGFPKQQNTRSWKNSSSCSLNHSCSGSLKN
jgi:hypothetical protein